MIALGQVLRSLRKRFLFSATSVFVLSIGIGAVTSIYTVVDGVLVEPPPYPYADRLVNVWAVFPGWKDDPALGDLWDRGLISYPVFNTLKDQVASLEDVAAYGDESMLLSVGNGTKKVRVGTAANLFETLGVVPVIGRSFGEDEIGARAERVALLSHASWTQDYGSDTRAVGATIRLNDHPYRIIGVLPETFRFPSLLLGGLVGTEQFGDHAVWVPIGHRGTDLDPDDRNYEIVGRLEPGASAAQVEAEAAILFGQRARVASRGDEETKEYAGTLLLLFGLSGVLLLISCGNAAGTFLSEQDRNENEVGVRLAIGAGRARIVGRYVSEALVIGLLASALGVAIAYFIKTTVLAYGPAFPHPETMRINRRVLMLAVACGGLSGLISSLWASLRLMHASPAALLRGSRPIKERAWFGPQAGPTAQVALTTVLLVAGGLMVKSLVNLAAVPTGFEKTGVVATRVSLVESRYSTPDQVNDFYRRVHRLIESAPGVVSASASRGVPFSSQGQAFNTIQRVDLERGVVRFDVRRTNVLPAYFRTLGIPMVSGRTFTWQDERETPRVAVVSEALARREWPEEGAIGREIVFRQRSYTVVGVVGDVRTSDLEFGIDPMLYLPVLQYMEGDMYVLARTGAGPEYALARVRSAILSVDPLAAIGRAAPLASFVRESVDQERFRTIVLVLFGVAAVLLSAVGVGGMVARQVTLRSKEWGVRAALGASPRMLTSHIVRRGVTPAAAGVGVGLLVSFVGGRFVSSFVFGVEAWDPATLGSVVVILMAVSVAASYAPARHASNVSPMAALHGR